MIRKVSFSNFYSFNKKQEFNFLANKKTSYSYTSSTSNEQITKIAAFIGANASGKTNVMRLFSFISYFVCASSKSDLDTSNSIPFNTFYNNKRTSDFYVEFEENNRIYYYTFSVLKNVVLSEDLAYKEKRKNARKIGVFNRKERVITYLNGDLFKDLPKTFNKNLRLDVSLIAFLKAHYSIEMIDEVFGFFFKFKTNINEVGVINNLHHRLKTLMLYLDDKELKSEMEAFIKSFDLGLEGFEIIKEGQGILVQGIHSTGEKSNRLPFEYESRGTQSLFYTLANVFTAIKSNSIVIIDEIEAGLHPEALNKLISYIIDENKDQTAQIIFSSHSLYFLNKLDMHQIFIAEKDEDGDSNVYRLNEVDGVRSDDNFLGKYMSGAYGGFPNIRV